MRQGARELLEAGLRELGISRPSSVSEKLLEYGELLLAENRRTNLTGAGDMISLVAKHFLDSLAALGLIEMAEPIVDVGSGAGLPGIPAAIAYPCKRIILLEPRARRANFLQSAVARLDLTNASVLRSSASGSEIADRLKGTAGTVLMRAVAEPGKALALGLPLLRGGGTLLLYEGRSFRVSPKQRKLAAKLSGAEIVVKPVLVPGLAATRHAWIARSAGGARGVA